jgi:lipoate-protein ligase B
MRWVELPLTDYRQALDWQRQLVEARIADTISDDVVLVVEHPPVFTLGRRGGLENLVCGLDLLEQRGIEVVQVERGGNITYHGPGQLVAYPIFNLKKRGLGVAAFVTRLEQAMIDTALQCDVVASRDVKNRGVWVGGKKLGSVGISVRRGISFHGLALNVNTDLKPFGWINPCGLSGVAMTSLAKQKGHALPMDVLRKIFRNNFQSVMGRKGINTQIQSMVRTS